MDKLKQYYLPIGKLNEAKYHEIGFIKNCVIIKHHMMTYFSSTTYFPFGYLTSVHSGLSHLVHISLIMKCTLIAIARLFLTSCRTCIFVIHTYARIFYRVSLKLHCVLSVHYKRLMRSHSPPTCYIYEDIQNNETWAD